MDSLDHEPVVIRKTFVGKKTLDIHWLVSHCHHNHAALSITVVRARPAHGISATHLACGTEAGCLDIEGKSDSVTNSAAKTGKRILPSIPTSQVTVRSRPRLVRDIGGWTTRQLRQDLARRTRTSAPHPSPIPHSLLRARRLENGYSIRDNTLPTSCGFP